MIHIYPRVKVGLGVALNFLLFFCDGGFERFDPVVDDAVEYCLQEKTKEECRYVKRRPPGPTPKVIGSVPDNNQSNVDPATKYIDLIFDQPMQAISDVSAIQVYLVSTVNEGPGTPAREELTPLSLEYSRLEWLDSYTVRLHLSWGQLPENAVIGYKPSTAFLTTLKVPVSNNEPLRRFSVGYYDTFFPLLKTNQYSCFYDSNGTPGSETWVLDANCSHTYTLYSITHPPGQNGHYEDNLGAPPNRRLMDGPLNNVAHNFTVQDANGNDITIRPVITEDATTNLTWASCSMPSKTLKRPPEFRTDSYYAAEPCIRDPGLYSWQEAIAVCGLLNVANNSQGYANKTNWRLPRFDELMTIVDYGYYNGRESGYPYKGPAVLFDEYNLTRAGSNAVVKRYFPYKIGEAPYWTSTGVKRPAYAAIGQPDELSFELMVVDFATGNYKAYAPFDPAKKAHVLCVSGDAPARSARTFTVATDVVSDNHHGLMWQRCLDGQSGSSCESGTPNSKKWVAGDLTGALNYCESLTLATYTDWRLPNIQELRTLYSKTFTGTLALDETAFPNSPGSATHATRTPNYLSSTTNVSFNENDSSNTSLFPHTWTLNFGLTHYWASLGVNMMSTRDKNANSTLTGPYARCVRSLP